MVLRPFNLHLENQGLEKSRKFQALQTWNFVFSWSPRFFQVYGINLAFFLGGDLEKNPGLQDLKYFKV